MPSADEREIARHSTLSADDLDQIMAKRGDANRLGYAMILLYLRHPGRALDAGERPPQTVLAYAAGQLGIDAGAFDDYARRDATRRSHLAGVMLAGGYATFDRAAAHAAVAFLTASAQTILRPGQPAEVSGTDPAAARSARTVRGGFGYALNILIDAPNNVALDVAASSARFAAEVDAGRDMLARTAERFGYRPKGVAADTAYGSAAFLAFVRDQGADEARPIGQRDHRV